MKDITFKQALKKAWRIMKKLWPLFVLLFVLEMMIKYEHRPIIPIILSILIIYWAIKDKPKFKESEPPKILGD